MRPNERVGRGTTLSSQSRRASLRFPADFAATKRERRLSEQTRDPRKEPARRRRGQAGEQVRVDVTNTVAQAVRGAEGQISFVVSPVDLNVFIWSKENTSGAQPTSLHVEYR